ncbi:zinc finger, CCHC-type [Artemisia annua]|uniref:Zinc finger, CCHC-type n=1 Tax=Artemisia annua TaxID=35608 RepID=A0A2U1MQ20_ARTAN|nr:zinc finger, CCHC-type [Artemisia annua]
MAQPDNSVFAAFKSHLERAKLTGKNFNDWHRSLRIVLRATGKLDYLQTPCPEEPTGPEATEQAKAEWRVELAKYNEVGCLMLQSMEPVMQKKFEHYFPFDMINELKQRYEKTPAVELYESLDKLHSCKHADGKPVEDYVNEMREFFDQLYRVGFGYPDNVQVHLINRALNKDFAGFVQNWNMHCSGKTVSELLALLVDYERHLPAKGKAPTPQVLAIQGGRIQKKSHVNKGKGKADKSKQVLAYQPNPKVNQNQPKKPKANPPMNKEQACHHCHQPGHWKRNCALYINDLRQKKQQSEAGQPNSSSGAFFIIELFSLSHKLNSWVYDTGCGIHICNTLQGFREERKLAYGEQFLHVGNGAPARVEAIGIFNLVLPSGLVLSLNNCHYAPSIVRGVISLSCLLDLGYHHTISSNGISVSLNGVFYFKAIAVNGIFELDMNDNDNAFNNNSMYSINHKRIKKGLDSSYLWHCRLAHIGKTHMEKLQHDGLLGKINDESFDKCESCIAGKMTKKPFKNRIERASDLLGLIHTDVCGPLRHVSRRGASYFLTFTDDYIRYGGEYLSQEFIDYLAKEGIVLHLTSPYTPQQNGVSERRNRTLQDMIRYMFNLTTLPYSFWDYALESAVRILNMVPTKKVDKTPYELWTGKAPNLSYQKVWGCEAYVKRDSADKLQQRSVKCIFVGYPKETMGYYFYYPAENKVFVARYGDFLEKELISQELSGREYDLEDDRDDALPSKNTSQLPEEPDSLGPPPEVEVVPLRRSERTMKAPERLCLNVECDQSILGDLNEPTSYKAAIKSPDKAKWQVAMDGEMQSMHDNEVWTEVDLPPGAKVVGSKWLYKLKTDIYGIVHTYKARLVAQGFTQTFGIDYEETFSPVADIRAIRILIAIAAYYDYEIWQMDVKTAFLNGRLDEDIYMEQPEGYVNPEFPNRVCKLQRFIYGLKQASRQCNKRFDEEIKKFGFSQNLDEPCVYHKASGSNVIFFILYVDDILIMGKDIPSLQQVKAYLGKCFSMNDLGEAAFILGIKIYRDRSRRLIGLSQSAYIDKILKRFNMQNSKKGYLPMQEHHGLSSKMGASTPAEVERMKRIPYASAVGSLMYAVKSTRPDVAFAQNLTSRWATKDVFLVYGGNPDPNAELDVTGYCDASWKSDKDDTKSQTGYVFVINGGAVDWRSKKQSILAMSATESEYVAASEAAMEAVWIRKFVSGLGVMPSIQRPIKMYCDNSAAITFAHEPGLMRGTRHFPIKYHYVREQVAIGEIELLKVHTDDNLADQLTKALPGTKLYNLAEGIGLRKAESFMPICD